MTRLQRFQRGWLITFAITYGLLLYGGWNGARVQGGSFPTHWLDLVGLALIAALIAIAGGLVAILFMRVD